MHFYSIHVSGTIEIRKPRYVLHSGVLFFSEAARADVSRFFGFVALTFRLRANRDLKRRFSGPPNRVLRVQRIDFKLVSPTVFCINLLADKMGQCLIDCPYATS